MPFLLSFWKLSPKTVFGSASVSMPAPRSCPRSSLAPAAITADDVPCVIALTIAASYPAYFRWIYDETRPNNQRGHTCLSGFARLTA
jgi:hypothetical protein